MVQRLFRACLLTSALMAVGRASAAEPDAVRAFSYLRQVCEIGPRISGTAEMQQQQEMLEKHFTEHGATVIYQDFDAVHPQTGGPVRLANLIVSWHPEVKQRVLLCCHYDTRPYADRDPVPANRTKPFLGANDGGSGVALFMEMAHHMAALNPTYGVDMVFFDAEELIYDSARDKYFLGSEHFAKTYAEGRRDYSYVCGVLVDMVADRDFRVYYEKYSLQYAGDVTRSIWEKAHELRVDGFVSRRKHEVRDDHLPLNQIARIPTCDIIDFDYPHWHTRNDVPAACSGETLAKVAKVLLAWLEDVPKPQ